jgi:regulator of sigma E protease
MSILIFIVILLVLVIVHESGHFFTAKKFGIRVDEFGFGFPPKIFGIKKGETEYTFNLLPLGGFVRIYGENPDEENTNGADAKRSFVNKPKWQQAAVLFAGVLANFLLAWLLFSIGVMSGLPTSVGSEPSGSKLEDVNLVVISVLAKSPAEKAGLEIGDKIINIKNDNNFTTSVNPETVKSFVVGGGGKEIDIEYRRGKNSAISVARMIPALSAADNKPEIGISMDEIGTVKLPFFTAIIEGLRLTWSMTKNTAVGLYTLIREGLIGHGSLASITGPVGLVGIVGDAYKFGFIYLLSVAALISVNLAIINLLPIPGLDGGRLFILLIEKIKGPRVNPKIINIVTMASLAILILLVLVITYHDVVKLF